MTQRDLVRLCKLWQKRLSLVDWKIAPCFGTQEKIALNGGGNGVGCTIWNADRKDAEIIILNPDLLTDDTPEEVLVHELEHILFEGHRPVNPRVSIPKEHAYNAMARALVRGYRRKKSA